MAVDSPTAGDSGTTDTTNHKMQSSLTKAVRKLRETMSPSPQAASDDSGIKQIDLPDHGANETFATPTKLTARRKGSIASMLTLPSFGVRVKQNQDSPLPRFSPRPSPVSSFKSFKHNTGVRFGEATAFRCDIHAFADDHGAAEAECKQMIIEAGGKIIDDFLYPGGFLYDMADTVQQNPLDNGDETADGGYITITPWIRFHAPQWDPLRMHPVQQTDTRATPMPWTPVLATPTRGRRQERGAIKPESAEIWVKPAKSSSRLRIAETAPATFAQLQSAVDNAVSAYDRSTDDADEWYDTDSSSVTGSSMRPEDKPLPPTPSSSSAS